MRLTVKRCPILGGGLCSMRVRVQVKDVRVQARDVVGELSLLPSPGFCWGWS